MDWRVVQVFTATTLVCIRYDSRFFVQVMYKRTTSFWNITIQRTSQDDWQKKIQQILSLSRDEIVLTCFDPTLIISLEGKRMNDLFKIKLYYISLNSIFCRTICFHREWLLVIRIYMVLNFSCISKFKIIHILLKASHSRWKQLVHKFFQLPFKIGKGKNSLQIFLSNHHGKSTE